MEFYEPFYISPDNIALFDERFIGYGSTRTSQVKSLNIFLITKLLKRLSLKPFVNGMLFKKSQFKAAITGGWNFSVITPVFAIHWGLHTMPTYETPRKRGVGRVVRMEQFAKSRAFYETFVKELECIKNIRTL